MKKTLISFLSLAIFLFAANSALAAGTGYGSVVCQPIYGGGQTCVQAGNLLINKRVENPRTAALQDNIDQNDFKFSPDQSVRFRIDVTNTGNTAITNIKIQDVFPQFTSFQSGPGNFDSNNKTLTFTIANLNPNETKSFDVMARVVPVNALPNDRAVNCVINQAKASAPAVNNGNPIQDNSQFCIQKQLAAQIPPTTKGGQQVLPAQQVPGTTKGGLKVFPPAPVTTTPSTGPEMAALLALLPGGAAGLFLRRKTSK